MIRLEGSRFQSTEEAISSRERPLNDMEGRLHPIAGEGYHGCENDRAWVIAQKMARHLHVSPPPNDEVAVERFIQRNLDRYLALHGREP
jgi:hypothetical protein